MSFQVHLTSEAKRNVREILEWIADRSTAGALRWLDAFEKAQNRLVSSAEACGLAPEDEAFEEPIRHTLFQTTRGKIYRLLFVIRGKQVYIVSVRGSGQNFVDPSEIDGVD